MLTRKVRPLLVVSLREAPGQIVVGGGVVGDAGGLGGGGGVHLVRRHGERALEGGPVLLRLARRLRLLLLRPDGPGGQGQQRPKRPQHGPHSRRRQDSPLAASRVVVYCTTYVEKKKISTLQFFFPLVKS